MKKYLLIFFCLQFVIACASSPVIPPKMNGVYKMGRDGDYKFNYFQLSDNHKLRILINYTGGDEAAIKTLSGFTPKMEWNYIWSRKDLSYSKQSKKLILDGRYSLTPDGFIENSVFLVVKNQRVVNVQHPDKKKEKYDYRVLNSESKPINQEYYSSVTPVEDTDNLLVNQGFRGKLISIDGKNITDYYTILDRFHGPYAKFYNGKAWGMINRQGEIVLKPRYKGINDYNNGVVGVFNGEKWQLLNSELKPISSFEYTKYFPTKENLCAVTPSYNSPWHYITTAGKTLPYVSKSIIPFSYSVPFVFIKSNQGTIVFNHKGREVVKLSRDYSISDVMSSKRFIIREDRKHFSLIDADGNNLLTDNTLGLSKISDNLIKFKIRRSYGLMDPNGNQIIKAKYSEIRKINNNLILLRHFDKNYKKGNLYDVFDISQNKKLDLPAHMYGKYISLEDDIYQIPFSDGHGWGIIDLKNNQIVIPQKYGYMENLKYGYFEGANNSGRDITVLDSHGEKLYQIDERAFIIMKSPEIMLVSNHESKIYDIKSKKILFSSDGNRLNYYRGLYIEKIK